MPFDDATIGETFGTASVTKRNVTTSLTVPSIKRNGPRTVAAARPKEDSRDDKYATDSNYARPS